MEFNAAKFKEALENVSTTEAAATAAKKLEEELRSQSAQQHLVWETAETAAQDARRKFDTLCKSYINRG
jgi:hypothetical protein